jgi:hypothetical protein
MSVNSLFGSSPCKLSFGNIAEDIIRLKLTSENGFCSVKIHEAFCSLKAALS